MALDKTSDKPKMKLYIYFNPIDPLSAIMFSIKLCLIIATLWMITLLFRATLIVPKSMDVKIKALLLTSLIPQCLNLIVYCVPISVQLASLAFFLDFCTMNAFIYLEFEVLQIFR